jgi:hypothetical protein
LLRAMRTMPSIGHFTKPRSVSQRRQKAIAANLVRHASREWFIPTGRLPLY